MEYQLTNEEFAQFKLLADAAGNNVDDPVFHGFRKSLLNKRFAGDQTAMINEICHRQTGTVLFHEKQVQRG